MIRRFLRAAAVAVLVASGGAIFAAPPAQAAGTPGYCPDGNGVTVVVDFNDLGGGVVIRCAKGEQSTGVAALQNAGFSVAGTTRWGLGFVCRIEGKPTVATEPCRDTPPTSAYWSYWHASNGGSWTYSDRGATRKPPSGSFEGWSFSKGLTQASAPRPDATPARPAAPPPPPANGGGGTQPGGGGTRPGSTGQPGGAQPGDGAQPPGGAQPGTQPGSPGPTASAPDAASAAPSDPASSDPYPATPVTDVATRPTASDGMPTGTFVGLGLLLAFAGAAGFTVWRRRRAGS